MQAKPQDDWVGEVDLWQRETAAATPQNIPVPSPFLATKLAHMHYINPVWAKG